MTRDTDLALALPAIREAVISMYPQGLPSWHKAVRDGRQDESWPMRCAIAGWQVARVAAQAIDL